MTRRSKQPVSTGREQETAGREVTQFKPGQSGNPAGRPKGSRNKLSDDFLTAVCEDFEKHGKKAIAEVRKNDPATYVRVVASLVPKELNVGGKINHAVNLNAVGLSATAAFIAEVLGAGPDRALPEPLSH